MTVSARSSKRKPAKVAEAIASRDQNNLYLTSRYFADPCRYAAFCAYYALMRVVDDRIDELPMRSGLSDRRRVSEHEVVSAWSAGVQSCYSGHAVPARIVEGCQLNKARLLFEAFASALRDFPVPAHLWSDFFRAMHRDVDHERFDTWQDFLTYAEGASVAPTTIYLFLIASRQSGGTVWLPADFDVFRCGRLLGLFAYLAHVVRDLAVDLSTGEEGLIYVSREDMTALGITDELLFADLEQGRASPATRRLVAELVTRARSYLLEARGSMACLTGQLEMDCKFVLELIVTTYARVLDKIEACAFDPISGRHRLTEMEKRAVVREVADRRGFCIEENTSRTTKNGGTP